jgi:hypothetical protein
LETSGLNRVLQRTETSLVVTSVCVCVWVAGGREWWDMWQVEAWDAAECPAAHRMATQRITQTPMLGCEG